VDILCHRGWWNVPSEQNTLIAFERAFEAGLGVELDIRDSNGKLVVSHDPVSRNTETLLFAEVLELSDHYKKPTIAINVKADGLIPMIKAVVDTNNIGSSFFFDMSTPESVRYLEAGFPLAKRLSEVERSVEDGSTYWLDSLAGDWWLETPLEKFSKTKCYLASPELHGRDHKAVWKAVHNLDFIQGICTDFFALAVGEFHEI
jgi:glycerophosphoryl diester phosphodiesterase